MDATDLTAAEAARRIAAGELSSEELVTACLARIDALEDRVRAWAHLDADHALGQARAADEVRQSGQSVGPLHGVPVGIKDIIDTGDLPTECGTELFAGRLPYDDAALVAALKSAGAVIMGKTVTTECALLNPGKTTNPHDPARTPGGSSSGSAAAVACNMVPLAVGTQTNGSVIRPAAFCGVVGYKPTWGMISRHGILPLSHRLDTVGVFARTVEDAALIGDSLTQYDARDAAMTPRGRRFLARTVAGEPPLAPNFAFVRSPVWDEADEDAREAFAELAAFLGEQCDEVTLPAVFDGAVESHRAVMVADVATNLAALYADGPDRLSESLRAMIEAGRQVLAVDYGAACRWQELLNAGLEEVFERYDAIITPATTGEAPPLDTTGNPVFCTLWTFCGVPAVSLPLLQGESGLPIGVQLVGPRGDDARLLRTARWLTERVSADE